MKKSTNLYDYILCFHYEKNDSNLCIKIAVIFIKDWSH